jgi:hypothetical protein
MKHFFEQILNWARQHDKIVVIGMVIIALLIRQYRLHELMIFTYDQGRDMYALQTISRGDIKLVGPTTGLAGFFLGPFFYYFLLPGFILSNGSPFGVVLWNMIWVTLALSLAYFLLKPWVGRRWATVGFVALLLAPASFEESRVMWNPSLTAATLLISWWAVMKSQNNPWWLLITALGLGLCLQTEFAYAIFVLPIFGVWVLTHLPKPFQFKKASPSFTYSWKVLAASLAFFGATLIPQALFEVKYNLLMTRSLIQNMGDVTKQVPYAQVWETRPNQMAEEIMRTITGKTENYQFWFILVLLFAMYTVVSAPQRMKPFTLFSYWLFALPVFGFMLHRGNYGYFFNYYLSPHYLVTIILVVVGLAQIARKFNLRWLPFAALVLSVGLFWNYARIILDVPRFQYTTKLQIDSLHYARSIHKTDNYALEVFVPNLIPVSYQYLSEWMSRTGQAEPVDYGLNGHKEYILIYEPAMGGGSELAFKEWYSGHTGGGAICDSKKQFGITTVERCVRQ